MTEGHPRSVARSGMRRWLLPASYPTFVLIVVLGFVSVGVAWLTFNLLSLAMANIDFLRRHGAMAVMEGGLIQLALIGAKGFGALVGYLVFRGVEAELLHRWTGRN